MDITKKEEVLNLFEREKPDWVVHTAALTDVDGCEKEKERAWAVNVEGSENIAEACREACAKLINISTDYVFNGKKGPILRPISLIPSTSTARPSGKRKKRCAGFARML